MRRRAARSRRGDARLSGSAPGRRAPGAAASKGGHGMVSRAAWLYISAVVAITVLSVASAPTHLSGIPHPLFALITLQALFLVCDSVKTPLISRQTKWSPSSAATLAAVVLLGPFAAALVGATSLISMRRQLQLPERLFNGAMHALCGLAAGEAYLALHGHVGFPMAAAFRAIRRGIRRRRGGARRDQSRPYLGHLPARPRQRDAAPRGAGVQPPAAARLRPRLRLPGPGHRLAVADHGVVRGAARAGTAVRRPLGDGTVRRAAACLRRDHERAVPGRRDEGLLHPRPR